LVNSGEQINAENSVDSNITETKQELQTIMFLIEDLNSETIKIPESE